jgi:hypothetical protein
MSLLRDPLPDTRKSITRRFQLPYHREIIKQIDGVCPGCGKAHAQFTVTTQIELMKIYFVVGLYDDGRPGEVFIKCDRSGSLASGALDAVAMTISIGLQYGIPLGVLIDKIKGSQFPPEGYTKDQEFPRASSVLDLLARWLLKMFPDQAA